VKRSTWILGIILVIVALVWFASGALRMGVLMLRANVGMYEALILAVLGLAVMLSSRRK
jgi:hypothetical protein